MHVTHLRKVGGSVMLAVPPVLLDLLDLKAGAPVGIAVEDGRPVVVDRPRPRYAPEDLLAQCDPDAERLREDSDWISSAPVGEELLRSHAAKSMRWDWDPTQGHEQQGRMPVLVISATAFNAMTHVPVVVPVTSGGSFARTRGFIVALSGRGLKTTGVVRCDQPRALDLDARGARLIESVPDDIVDDVLAKVVAMLG